MAGHALINGVRQQAGHRSRDRRQAGARGGRPVPHHPRRRRPPDRGSRRPRPAPRLDGCRRGCRPPRPPSAPAAPAAPRCGFSRDLPRGIDADTRERAGAPLAELGTQYRPELLAKLADNLADWLNPDGNFSDPERARRRALILGNQDADRMSLIKGYLSPAARAALEAVLATLAAPGMTNPDDPNPAVDRHRAKRPSRPRRPHPGPTQPRRVTYGMLITDTVKSRGVKVGRCQRPALPPVRSPQSAKSRCAVRLGLHRIACGRLHFSRALWWSTFI